MADTVGGAVGSNIGDFLGGILSPVAGAINPLLGKSSTEKTTGADEATIASRRTMTIVIAALAILTLGVVAWALFKNKA